MQNWMKNNQITKASQIPESAVTTHEYFQSLMAYCSEWGLLSFQQIQDLFGGLMGVTVKQCLRYNGTDSSSIPQDTAKEVGEGVLYTVNYALSGLNGPDNALACLMESSMEEVFSRGKKGLRALVEKTKHQYTAMIAHMPQVDSHTYNSTILQGIPGFIKKYDVEFMPHQNTATMDYPLAGGDLPTTGIVFLHDYIQCVHYENKLISIIPSNDLKVLLKRYDPLYKENLTNMVTAVASAAPEILEGIIPFLSVEGQRYIRKIQGEVLHDPLYGQSHNELSSLAGSADNLNASSEKSYNAFDD